MIRENDSVVIRVGSRRKTADDRSLAIAETVDRINDDEHIEGSQIVVTVDIVKQVAGMLRVRRQFSRAHGIELVDEQQHIQRSDQGRIVDVTDERSIPPIARHQVARFQSFYGSLFRFHC